MDSCGRGTVEHIDQTGWYRLHFEARQPGKQMIEALMPEKNAFVHWYVRVMRGTNLRLGPNGWGLNLISITIHVFLVSVQLTNNNYRPFSLDAQLLGASSQGLKPLIGV